MKRFMFSLLALACACAASAYDYVALDKQYSSLSFKTPVGAALSGDKLVVADSDVGSVFLFDSKDSTPRKLGAKGKGDKSFQEPVAVAAGKNGRFYVLDSGAGRVAVLDEEGNFLFTFGSRGSRPGQFSGPQAIAAGYDGRIYVADTGNSRIQVFTPDGILSLVVTEGISSPTGVAVDYSDNIYVSNKGAQNVVVLGPSGEKFTELPIAAKSICVDEYGYVYALDASRGKVREYNPAGMLTGEFGSEGRGQGQLYRPSYIISGGNGLVLVADTGNRRILSFRITVKDKGVRLPAARITKLSISGPVAGAAVSASQFAPMRGGVVAAFLAETRQLVLLDAAGAVKTTLSSMDKKFPLHIRKAGGMSWSEKAGLVVSDSDSDTVYIFSSTGGLKAVLGEKSGMFGGSSKEGRFDAPAGVETTDNGSIFIADSGNARIQQFNADGMYINSIGPKLDGVTLSQPVDVYWTGADLLILDRKLKKVIQADPASGRVLSAWGEAGESPGQFSEPVSVAYDGRKFAYVLDKGDSRVKVFDLAGKWQGSFFAKGSGVGNFAGPEEMYFTDNSLWISDSVSRRLDKYAMNILVAPPAMPTGTAKEDRVKIAWQPSDKEWVSNYTVYRSTLPSEIGVQAGVISKTEFTETLKETPATYYYRVASRSLTGEPGQASNALRLFAPGSPNIAKLEIGKVDLGYIFSANYKYYLRNPVGKVTIVNNSDTNFKNVKVSFALKDFMDYPYDTVVPEIEAKSKASVPLICTLNNRILEVSEDTPVQAQLSVSYYEQGDTRTLSINQPVKVLSRFAIIWDTAARLANFVTPKDPPVFGFGRAALMMRPEVPETANRYIASAIMLWDAVTELGVSYMSDPSNPYSRIKSDVEHPLDSVQPARDTLRLRSGKCSDMTALFSSLFESAGLHTAFIDYPTHIQMMFDTGVSDPGQLGLPADRVILYDGTYWLPLETTLAGSAGFMEANRQAALVYARAGAEAKIIDTHKAWADYEPMTLPETSWTAPLPEKVKAAARFNDDMKALAKLRTDYLRGIYEAALSRDDKDVDALNGLGVLAAENGDYNDALSQFKKILAADPANSDALNNIGNVSYMKGDYKSAAEHYEKASAADPSDGGVLLNRARAALKSGDKDAARSFASKAAEADPDLAGEAQAISSGE
ncbi:MAG: tetratricopeptide repeat protein [Elusimicrobiales bacterium]|nr:tetratricopeptide repeat protein [Elusimicrobiales bacterium]